MFRSRLTAQCQISIPADIRRRLGLEPGSSIEWDDSGDQVVVRRAGKYSSEDIHKALFGDRPPQPATVEQMDESIRTYMRKKHARNSE